MYAAGLRRLGSVVGSLAWQSPSAYRGAGLNIPPLGVARAPPICGMEPPQPLRMLDDLAPGTLSSIFKQAGLKKE
jgi:hypothetical protein